MTRRESKTHVMRVNRATRKRLKRCLSCSRRAAPDRVYCPAHLAEKRDLMRRIRATHVGA